MASIVAGSIVCDIRGAIGTEIYSRGPGGLYVKARTSPAQPASAARDQAQTNFTAATQGWSARLSAAQRAAWRAYGVRYPRPNRWGEPTITSGYLAFVRSNLAMKTITPASWIDDPPDRGMLTAPIFTFSVDEAAGINTANLTLNSAVLLESDYYLMITSGQTVNVGVDYYSTPWRSVQESLWNGAVWAPIITAIALPAWTGTGDKLFMKAYLFDSNSGAISIPFMPSAIVNHI